MNHWQATFLGLKQLPRELSGFEIEAFFTFTASERALIEARRGPSLKLGLALQIGFLRMSGRVLDAVRIVPPALWKHLGNQFGEQAPDLASLRAMYRRHRTLFDHQELACEALGFHPLIEAQRRALVRTLRRELKQTADRRRFAAANGCSFRQKDGKKNVIPTISACRYPSGRNSTSSRSSNAPRPVSPPSPRPSRPVNYASMTSCI
jgi:hypothetical protein